MILLKLHTNIYFLEMFCVCEYILQFGILENQEAKTTHWVKDVGESLGLRIRFFTRKGKKKKSQIYTS